MLANLCTFLRTVGDAGPYKGASVFRKQRHSERNEVESKNLRISGTAVQIFGAKIPRFRLRLHSE